MKKLLVFITLTCILFSCGKVSSRPATVLVSSPSLIGKWAYVNDSSQVITTGYIGLDTIYTTTWIPDNGGNSISIRNFGHKDTLVINSISTGKFYSYDTTFNLTYCFENIFNYDTTSNIINITSVIDSTILNGVANIDNTYYYHPSTYNYYINGNTLIMKYFGESDSLTYDTVKVEYIRQ